MADRPIPTIEKAEDWTIYDRDDDFIIQHNIQESIHDQQSNRTFYLTVATIRHFGRIQHQCIHCRKLHLKLRIEGEKQ